MIGTDISRRVTRLMGDTDLVTLSTSDLIDWINDGMLRISKVSEYKHVSTSVVATAFPWPLPVDFVRASQVVYGQVPLVYVDIEELDAMSYDLTDRASPSFFYKRLNAGIQSLCLYPLAPTLDPTMVYIEYIAVPTAIAALANTLDIPDAFREELVQFVLSKAHERNENYRAQEYVDGKFSQLMAKATDEINRPDDTYPLIRSDPLDTVYW